MGSDTVRIDVSSQDVQKLCAMEPSDIGFMTLYTQYLSGHSTDSPLTRHHQLVEGYAFFEV